MNKPKAYMKVCHSYFPKDKYLKEEKSKENCIWSKTNCHVDCPYEKFQGLDKKINKLESKL